MRVNFEYDMHLQYENRALKARIRELESGVAYVRMQEECEKRCREMEREVRKLKTELENAVRQLRQNREHWFQVYGDMEKEHKNLQFFISAHPVSLLVYTVWILQISTNFRIYFTISFSALLMLLKIFPQNRQTLVS